MKPGEVVAGRYRLDARLGVGGMGEVWRATHDATSREFAIKFMNARAATSASARQRFTREARVSAKINHPNVIDIFDAGEHDEGTLFLAMELLDGISLADAFHLAPPLSVQDLLIVMHDTARALAAAHAVDIVHRDIKPANIFLHRERGSGFASAKVLDFGISKFGGLEESHHTKTGAVLGSPRYMSPEQTRSAASVDPRADIWACGVILFEGLTGTWPHEGDSFSSLVVAICTVPPTSIDRMVPDLPESVRSIVRGCLQPVGRRIPSAVDLAERLAAALQDPALAQWPLARPLHPPSESIKASSGVRIRPLLTTTGGSDVEIEPDAPDSDSLRTTRALSQPTPLPPRLGPPPPLPPPLEPEGEDNMDELATTPIPPALVAAALARISAKQALPPPAPAPAPAAFRPPPNAAFQFNKTLPLDDGPPPVRAELSPALHAPAAAGPPQGSAFQPFRKTLPLDDGIAMQAELVRAGIVHGSPVSFAQGGTTRLPLPGPALAGPTYPGQDSSAISVDTITTAAVREPNAAVAQPLVRAAPTFGAPPPPGRSLSESRLRVAVAVLAVLLVGIVVALIAILRSGPAPATAPAISSAAATDRTAEQAPPPSAVLTATATAVPTAAASSAPVDKAKPGRGPNRGSRGK